MRRFSLCFMVLAGFVLYPAIADASALSKLKFGVVNELEDDDFETLINAGGTFAAPGADTVVHAGDFIAGIIRISAIRVPPGGLPIATFPQPSNTFTGIFVQKVIAPPLVLAGGAADGVNDVIFSLGAPTLAEWGALGLPAHLVPVNAGTIGILFDDPDDIDQSLATIPAAVATVGGTKLWEIGFLGLGGELWTAATDTADITTAFSVITGSFSANVNVTGYFGGPLLVPQPVVGGAADILIRNGSIGAGAPGSAFPVSSDTDLLLIPVPEPGSMILWGGLAFFGASAARRRRKANF
jgi:hypothetical protein